MEWSDFFPPRSRVLALPGWDSPRLYFSAGPALHRWRCSGFFPGWRAAARAARMVLKLKAVLLPGPARSVDSPDWTLGAFVKDIFPDACSVVLQVNPRNAAGKFVAQLRDPRCRVLGYVKYGQSVMAQERLRNEYTLLNALPPDTGPAPLTFGELDKGAALCLSAVRGKHVPPALDPPAAVGGFLGNLPSSDPLPLHAHPWIAAVRSEGSRGIERWLEPLASRDWPTVLQHGDFAPWNLIRVADNSLRALDWEYGCTEGFPYLDIAYYLLQVGLLVKGYSSGVAVEEAVHHLCAGNVLEALPEDMARSITALAAYEQYTKSAEDGHNPNTPVQRSRLAIWKGET
ncbi:MAG: phosphotransferase [Chitinivibrionales bacterium]|nr:phosphotransferase [Chitinivibrionales bacterium]MBD3394691.1 phosphotransferase [Chitinivibrionales bacterium]